MVVASTSPSAASDQATDDNLSARGLSFTACAAWVNNDDATDNDQSGDHRIVSPPHLPPLSTVHIDNSDPEETLSVDANNSSTGECYVLVIEPAPSSGARVASAASRPCGLGVLDIIVLLRRMIDAEEEL